MGTFIKGICFLGCLALLGGCARSAAGIDTTGKVMSAADCRYYPEPHGLPSIKLESPNAAVLKPSEAPTRAIVVRSGVCSGRDAIDVVTLTPDGEPSRTPAGEAFKQKYTAKVIPAKEW